tara:strand:+ start:795 stop:956 length:162 start_codon:yes stop_codon:yes gene_type:complete
MHNMKTANKYKKYNPTTEQEHWFVDFFFKENLSSHQWYEDEDSADAAIAEWVE